MALIIKDRVKETTTTTGTGTITLAGASTGFRSFADIGNANTTYYTIAGGNDWEVGLGTYTASGTALSRDTVLSNSLGTTALINFSAGTKDVFVTYPSEKALLGDTSAISSTGTGSVVLSASPTLTGTVQLPNSSFSSVTSTIGYAANVSVGQTNYLTNNTIQIGGNEPDPIGGAASTINIGANYTEVGESSANPTTTNINGDVVFPAATASESVIFNKQVSITSGVSFSVAGNFNLTGSATSNQNIATNQTSGSLTIGGTGATGAITLGRSTGTQTVGIATGVVGSGATKTVNIGTGSSSVGATVVNIGQPIGGTNNGNLTVAIGRQTRSAGTTTIGIGNATVSGTGATNISIGNTTGTTIMSGNVIFDSLQLPAFVGQNTQIVDDLLTSAVGKRAFVTDASTPVFGMPVSGGGSTPVPVYYDGTTWRVG